MVVYSCSKISQTVIGDAKIAIRPSFPRSFSQFSRNFQVAFMVVYGCSKISQTVIGDAKIAIRISFLRSFTQFSRNSQVAFMIVNACFNISQTVMGAASFSHAYHLCLCTSFLQRNCVKNMFVYIKNFQLEFQACET